MFQSKCFIGQEPTLLVSGHPLVGNPCFGHGRLRFDMGHAPAEPLEAVSASQKPEEARLRKQWRSRGGATKAPAGDPIPGVF